MSYVQNEYQFQELFNKRHYPKETKARVLPFYVVNNNIYFLLCEESSKRDCIQGTYNILGGYRESNETIIEYAKRELQEESLNTILFNESLSKKEFILRKNKRYIIFLPILFGTSNIIPQFEQHKALLENNKVNDTLLHLLQNHTTKLECLCEIKCLNWINEREIRGRKMYRSVQDVFKNIYSQQTTEILFENYMNYLKQSYRFICNNRFPNLKITPSNNFIRNSIIIGQEYFTSASQRYSA